MKNRKLLLIIMLLPYLVNSQSVSPQVITTAGDYYESANALLSWTLGELSTETYSAGNIILTQGFQQPIVLELTVDLKAFLSGSFNFSDMNTDLNSGGLLPLVQPYNTPPWLYYGTESVTSIPNSDVVDWFLLELRDATNAVSALPGTMFAQQAAFVLKDGSVVGLDGVSNIRFSNTVSLGLFVVIWHRNHVGIMSANPLTKTGGVYTYDFTTSESKVHGGSAGYTEITAGVWGMSGGDGDGNGEIQFADKLNVWNLQVGFSGYLKSDFNLDGQSDNADKNDNWLPNLGKGSFIPE